MILSKEQFRFYNEIVDRLKDSGDYVDARNILYELIYEFNPLFSDEELANLITAIETRDEISDGSPIKYYKIKNNDGGYLYYSQLYKNPAYSETPVRVRENELKSIFSDEYIEQHRDTILDWED